VLAPSYPADVVHYKHWTRLVTLQGIESAYSGTFYETYAIYPPAILYPYKLVGHLYQTFQDPTFDEATMLESRALTIAIKAVAVGLHLALGLAIFALVAAAHGVKWGGVVGTLYLLNPAAIFDVAYWDQPDPAHALWTVLAFGLLALGSQRASWVCAGLAAMTKPQAWALLPLLAYRQLRTVGPRQTAFGLGLWAIAVIIVILPFIATGHVPELLGLPSHIAGVVPVASANAHNLWWLVTGGHGFVMADEPFLGPLTYERAALELMAALLLFVLWMATRQPPHLLFFLAAYQAFGWFVVTTRAHENHAFFVLPLLAMAIPTCRLAGRLFVAISVTLLLNMVLHDPLLAPRLAAGLSADVVSGLQLANSAANVVILIVWTAWLVRARVRVSS
jgi:Gpi18-like mannosyltransferase